MTRSVLPSDIAASAHPASAHPASVTPASAEADTSPEKHRPPTKTSPSASKTAASKTSASKTAAPRGAAPFSRDIFTWNAQSQSAAQRIAAEMTPSQQESLRALLRGETCLWPADRPAARVLWKGGQEPMPFDAFCTALDTCRLFPRQLKAFAETNALSARSFVVPGATAVQEWLLIFGKGAGKDYLCAKLAAYVAYVLLHLQDDPARHFGLAEYSQLSIVNIAPTEKQARTVFFSYLKRFLQTPLFAPFLRDPRRQIHADDILFFRTTDAGAEYCPLAIWSMHSGAAGLEGKNIIFWVMDEADAFFDSGDRSNADELHAILRSSASTRFSGSWHGVVISYPRVESGFVMRLKEKAEHNSNYYCDLAATWDVNPNVKRDSPDIQADYDNDPAHAAALYECLPLPTTDGFFDSPEKIDAAVDADRQPCAYVIHETIDRPLRSGDTAYYVSARVSNIARVLGYSYFLGGDAGVKGDAYALAVFHTDTNPSAFKWLCPRCGRDPEITQFAEHQLQYGFIVTTSEEDAVVCDCCYAFPSGYSGMVRIGKTVVDCWYKRTDRDESTLLDGNGEAYTIGRVYEDLLVRIKPVKKTRVGEVNRPVYFPGVQTLVKELVVGLDIKKARFDPYQTAEITQGLIDSTGADVGEISFSGSEQFKRARLVKAMLHADMITLLPDAQRDKEWKRLQRAGPAKIDHPAGSGEGKDLFDAESVAIWLAATANCGRLELLWR